MHVVALGFGLGFVVAAAIGPISLLCIRTVLRGALGTGIAIGAGAAVIDATYALLGAIGAGRLLEIDALALTLGLVGAAVLALLGLRTLWSAFRVRLGGESDDEVATPARAFLTSLAATASNPTTILSWAAVFAAASTASAVDGTGETLLLCLGVGCGTLTWFTVLSLGLTAIRARVGDRLLKAVDIGSGLGLLLFSGALGVRAARDAQ
ncbi:LysE family translocator [Baekduia sp.]|jgi:putative LysE/RhtB family amino acid efflux pump|uniref:LysE family translocator n=1 Tax=Baekduia sp. TaxID=2600305 RepID=UPI002E0B042C|nr:LysE family transporter [Baekduia sp.]